MGICKDTLFQIDIANNGKEAVEKFRKGEYSLILMDIEMPIMDGYEATRLIRVFNKDVPILALNSHRLNDVSKKGGNVGMNEYLSKPIEPKRLYETFFRYIGRR